MIATQPDQVQESMDPLVDAVPALLRLAAARDYAGRAISYYCTSEAFAASTHWETSEKLKSLLDHANESSSAFAGVPISSRLSELVHEDEQTRQRAPRFQAAFECLQSSIFEEFAIPAPGSLCALEIGAYFHIFPLWKALQAARPYLVALVGQEGARCFRVKGVSIQEVGVPFPSVDLSEQGEVPWSHHVEGNAREREKHFLKDVLSALRAIVEMQGHGHLVIGCREEVWAELGPLLMSGNFSSSVAGHFHLPNLRMANDEVLQYASETMAAYRKARATRVLDEVREHPERSATQVDAALRALQSGRVEKMILGDTASPAVSECSHCGECFVFELAACPSCRGTTNITMRADEMLLRKALQTGVEILPAQDLGGGKANDVVALMRY